MFDYWWLMCIFCGQEISMMGNLINMYVLGYGYDLYKFVEDYGMLCVEYVGELMLEMCRKGLVVDSVVEEVMEKVMMFMC